MGLSRGGNGAGLSRSGYSAGPRRGSVAAGPSRSSSSPGSSRYGVGAGSSSGSTEAGRGTSSVSSDLQPLLHRGSGIPYDSGMLCTRGEGRAGPIDGIVIASGRFNLILQLIISGA